MSPMSKELLFEIADLRYLGIACDKCHTEIVCDLAKANSIPTACPTCRHGEYDTLFLSALESLRANYQTLSKAKNKVRVRIREQITTQ